MKIPVTSPVDTVERLIAALNQGNLEAAVSLYEADAVFYPEPGREVQGRESIREALAGLLALKPRLSSTGYRATQTGTTALYCSHWRMQGTAPDGSAVELGGSSSDVLRRQEDGSWLIAIDNPFGPAIVAG